MQLDVLDYKEAGGVRVPSRWIVTEIRRRRWTYQLDAIAVNGTIPDARFTMPAEHAH